MIGSERMKNVYLLMIALSLFSCSDTVPCTMAGCHSYFDFEIIGGKEWVGVLSFDTTRVYFDCRESNVRKTQYSCSDDGVFFILNLNSFPSRIILEIHSTEKSWNGVVIPEYKYVYPNGPGCDPVCVSLQKKITL